MNERERRHRHRSREGQGGGGETESLGCHGGVQHAQSRTAETFRHQQAGQAEFHHALPQVVVETVRRLG